MWEDGHVHSQGLSLHLNHKSKITCHEYYHRNGLFPIVRGKSNFRSSLLTERARHNEIMQFHPSLPRRTPKDFGLTGAVNGPHCNSFRQTQMISESNKISHALLNQQTLFVGTIPGVCRENIRAQLSMDDNKDDNGSSDSMVDQVGIDHDDQTTDFQLN